MEMGKGTINIQSFFLKKTQTFYFQGQVRIFLGDDRKQWPRNQGPVGLNK